MCNPVSGRRCVRRGGVARREALGEGRWMKAEGRRMKAGMRFSGVKGALGLAGGMFAGRKASPGAARRTFAGRKMESLWAGCPLAGRKMAPWPAGWPFAGRKEAPAGQDALLQVGKCLSCRPGCHLQDGKGLRLDRMPSYRTENACPAGWDAICRTENACPVGRDAIFRTENACPAPECHFQDGKCLSGRVGIFRFPSL